MRKTISLTGRKTIPVSSVAIRIDTVRPQNMWFEIRKKFHFNGISRKGVLKLRLFESKALETLVLGELGMILSAGQPIQRRLKHYFARPSCQVRVVERGVERRGLLLGSTRNWTIESRSEDQEGDDTKGILRFAAKDLGLSPWILECADSVDYPTLYLHNSIPNAKARVKSDPVFQGLLLPAVIRQILAEILATEDPSGVPWMTDWLDWVKSSLSEDEEPPIDGSPADKTEWIERMVYAFCVKHPIRDRLTRHLQSGSNG